MNTLTFFENTEELLELTQLKTAEELWQNGFNLDDWDYGFVADKCYVKKEVDEFTCEEYFIRNDAPWHIYKILNAMDDCVGFKMVEYNGKFYYITYHS